MRTTLDIDKQLLAEAKAVAARSGRSLNAVVEDALHESLARRSRPNTTKVALPTFKGSGLQPGVDLDDSAALLELHEGKARHTLTCAFSIHQRTAHYRQGLLDLLGPGDPGDER